MSELLGRLKFYTRAAVNRLLAKVQSQILVLFFVFFCVLFNFFIFFEEHKFACGCIFVVVRQVPALQHRPARVEIL